MKDILRTAATGPWPNFCNMRSFTALSALTRRAVATAIDNSRIIRAKGRKKCATKSELDVRGRRESRLVQRILGEKGIDIGSGPRRENSH